MTTRFSFVPRLRICLCHSAYDGTPIAQYELEGYGICSPVLAPGGLLFCVKFENGLRNLDRDEILALDAQTLQVRYRFGLELLNDVNHLAVVADELYVCDTANDRLQVFSLTGEHRRSIKGEWKSPYRICFAKDRLYLVEKVPEEDDEDDEGADGDGDTSIPWPGQGRQIIVLSLLGDTLAPARVSTNSFRNLGGLGVEGNLRQI